MDSERQDSPAGDLFIGSSEMARRMRGHDWASTALGPPSGWPPTLLSAVGICLASRFPIAIYWGPTLSLLYNDAWAPIPGAKHPWALGRPAQDVWPEIWPQIGPLFDSVLASGEGVWQRDQLLPMHRHGYTEECYFDFTFSPIRGGAGGVGEVGGIFNAVIETSFRVVDERRTGALRDLSEQTAGGTSIEQTCLLAARALGNAAADLPFGLFYVRDADGAPLYRLAAAFGAPLPSSAVPAEITDGSAAPWPLSGVRAAAEPLACDDLALRLGSVVHGTAWPEPLASALLAPIGGKPGEPPDAVLVAGLSPRRRHDAAYTAFVQRVAAQMAQALAHARAFDAERQRAEALAEIDRAKTAFFTNISHEFRTPLTLMLAPLADSLAEPGLPLPLRLRLDTAQRNAQRLLRLVNNLLDFSRNEAGRDNSRFQPVDLAVLTANLCGGFRSLVERAGLRFEVDCAAIGEPVYVAWELWEKIVLNLLSNAFKFTLEGGISVRLRRDGASALLDVADSGVGMPQEELPRIFERFHRLQNAGGRSHEGSGIGLALVRDLVLLHGGSIAVQSAPGAGSTFTVSLPLGSAHLPAERVVHQPPPELHIEGATPYLLEAERWQADAAAPDAAPLADTTLALRDLRFRGTFGARVLVADDNADMRAYLRGLLEPTYKVQTVADGRSALHAAQQAPPELLLSDVMMPGLDGFALLRELRTDPALRSLPVLLLSARAGDDERVAGFAAGADDYLVKPFSARELLARVGALIERSRLLAEVAQRQAFTLTLSDRLRGMHTPWEVLGAAAQAVGEHLRVGRCGYCEIDAAGEFFDVIADWDDGVMPGLTGRMRLADFGDAVAAGLRGGQIIRVDDTWLDPRTRNVFDAYDDIGNVRAAVTVPLIRGGRLVAAFYVAQTQPRQWTADELSLLEDVAERTRSAVAEQRVQTALRVSEQRYRALADNLPGSAAFIFDTDLRYQLAAGEALATSGMAPGDLEGRVLHDVLDPSLALAYEPNLRKALAGEPFTSDHSAHGSHFVSRGSPLRDADGRVNGVLVVSHDVSDRVRAQQVLEASVAALESAQAELRAADRQKDEFLATLAHELRNPMAPIRYAAALLRPGVPAQTIERARSVIERQSAQMSRLLDDLLDLSRITRNVIELQQEALDLRDILREAVDTARPGVEALQHTLHLALPATALPVHGDSVRLLQVFGNLLTNAGKYSPPGSTVVVRAELRQGMALATVCDTGIGISREMLPRLFKLFSQVHNPLQGVQGGLGIGLAVVRRLVELHGGTVQVHSDGLGRGAEFTVELPLADAASGTQQPGGARPAAAAAEAAALSMLVVDDNVDAAQSLALLLEGGGTTVAVAHDGASALEAARTLRPDVVLLDLGLPDISGDAVARALRAEPFGARLLLVAITGWGQQQDRQRTADAGFDLHLVKPVDPGDLLRAVRAAVQRPERAAPVPPGPPASPAPPAPPAAAPASRSPA